MLAWHKSLSGSGSRRKVHMQWVQISDAVLLADLREHVREGQEIEVTIATDWSVEGAPSYVAGFALPEPPTGRTSTMRIAIDGPSASGKSAVGSRVAARLGYPFVDTGSMYRAITWLALRRGVDPDAAAGLAALAESARLEIGPPPADGRETCSISVNGIDITRSLRDVDVERAVSQVSAVPAVREVMVRLQRQAAPAQVVMAGRDIGTVVLPDAELKVYVEASLEVVPPAGRRSWRRKAGWRRWTRCAPTCNVAMRSTAAAPPHRCGRRRMRY
jgi:cytidylate kinase